MSTRNTNANKRVSFSDPLITGGVQQSVPPSNKEEGEEDRDVNNTPKHGHALSGILKAFGGAGEVKREENLDIPMCGIRRTSKSAFNVKYLTTQQPDTIPKRNDS
ncbi:hypothetical protein L873DRAFT_1841743 [Choiromyces venosus 120613-1]|uniref:Uncharacterized protein n=1 Tax=Choiromyces venosus 120613-1 TaxID=1336337 RepID=A0A3N4JWL3_9PEZI|nr:hypothetical protein L873DRAFT_1841743 [Choiromyces venosus 120613-1]